MTVLWSLAEQQSEEWFAARCGCITGSMFATAREKTSRGLMSARSWLYAMDTARERAGGTVAPAYANAAMRTGTEQEPMARMAYEAQTGNLVQEVGFAYTDDGLYGCSVDGLVGSDGMVEIKTMVSSATLFRAVVDGDHSDYIAQIDGAMWLLSLAWCDLCLWAPDLPVGQLTVVRIERDEARIEALESDLVAFNGVVQNLALRLQTKMTP